MKKLLSLLLAVLLLLGQITGAVAVEQTKQAEFSVTSLAASLLEDALQNNAYFNLRKLSGEVYLCNPVHPYYMQDGTFVADPDIEYYFIKSGDAYVACVTACYENGELSSVTFNPGMAAALEAYDVNSAFLMVVNDGTLYVKTEDEAVVASGIDFTTRTAPANDPVCNQIETIAADLQQPTVMQALEVSLSPVTPRSSTQFYVPYVPQGNYDICWAAAAGAFGQYYTGNTYSHYSALELANLVGVGNNVAGMDKIQEILSQVFHINTTQRTTSNEYSFIISKLVQHQPILAGFANSESGHMVVLCGYDDNATGKNIWYYVRDSNFEAYQIVVSRSDQTLVMDYYSQVGAMTLREIAYKS